MDIIKPLLIRTHLAYIANAKKVCYIVVDEAGAG